MLVVEDSFGSTMRVFTINRGIIMKRVFAVFMLTFALASCSGMPGGEGVVLETGTGAPVAGALVKLECRRTSLHGSVMVKTLLTTTGVNGRFSFSAADVAACSFAYVGASKPGYVPTAGLNLMYGDDDYRNLPKQIVLTPEGDQTMVRLQSLAAEIRATSSANHSYLYTILYKYFDEAQKIATTNKERSFVLITICPRLVELYATLSDKDRAEVRRTNVMRPEDRIQFDHEGKVVPYCNVSLPHG